MSEEKRGRGRPKKEVKPVSKITALNTRKKEYEKKIKSLTKGKKAGELTSKERTAIGTAKYQLNRLNKAIGQEYLSNEKYAGNKRFQTMGKNLIRSANASDRARRRESELRRYNKHLGGRWNRADETGKKEILKDLKEGGEIYRYYKGLSSSDKRKFILANKEWKRRITKHKRELKEQQRIEAETKRAERQAEKLREEVARTERRAERLRNKEKRAARNGRSVSDGPNIKAHGQIDEASARKVYQAINEGKAVHYNTLKHFSKSQTFSVPIKEEMIKEYKETFLHVASNAVKVAGKNYSRLSRSRKMKVMTEIAKELGQHTRLYQEKGKIKYMTHQIDYKAQQIINREASQLSTFEKVKGSISNEKIDVNEVVNHLITWMPPVTKEEITRGVMEKYRGNIQKEATMDEALNKIKRVSSSTLKKMKKKKN